MDEPSVVKKWDPEVLEVLGLEKEEVMSEVANIDSELLQHWSKLINTGFKKEEGEALLNTYKR